MSATSTTTSCQGNEESTTTIPAVDTSEKPIRVVFIHLDLGIGGAEQLVLSLASASQDLKHEVSIVTSRCDQDHCFSQVKQPEGRLSNQVQIWGQWIPADIFGKATALCSTLRMLYLAYKTSRTYKDKVDVIVMDVLPTPIPLLIYWYNMPSVLFYCHFPDKLLTRDTVNGVPVENTTRRFPLFVWYRAFLDWLEETTMAFADVLVVNSKFTLSQVKRVFPSLQEKPMRVLYPVLDTTKFDTLELSNSTSEEAPIVSLNRFERKKNIQLLLMAYAELLDRLPSNIKPPPLVIAGGYDTKNVENVEYMGELRELAKSLGIKPIFKPSVSDEERTMLFTTALVVVYTPHLEHFGIVPLEAMYAGRPVVAVNSGGPMETIVDGTTGFLCDATPQAFAQALKELVVDPQHATEMGKAGHERVKQTFGTQAFQRQWNLLLKETIQQGKLRRNRPPPYLLSNGFFYMMEAVMVLVFCFVLTWVLRHVGILAPNATIWGTVRDVIYRHEEL